MYEVRDPLQIAYLECASLLRLKPTHTLARYFSHLEDQGITREFHEKFSSTKQAPIGEEAVSLFYGAYFQALRQAKKEVVEEAIRGKLVEVLDGDMLRYKGVVKYIVWDDVSFYATIALENKLEFLFAPERMKDNLIEGHSFQPKGDSKVPRTVTILPQGMK